MNIFYHSIIFFSKEERKCVILGLRMYCLHKNYFYTGVPFIMKKSRITTALLAIGISASMVFQTPVFATEETAAAASSGITTNGISGWPQGS